MEQMDAFSKLFEDEQFYKRVMGEMAKAMYLNYRNSALGETSASHRKKPEEIKLIPPGTILNDVNNDNDVRRLIHNMMGLDEGTTIMQIVVECQKEFQEKYFNMKGNDWRHLVRDYVREVTEQPDLQENEVFRFSMAG
jgi:type I restriction enzyme R subunit